MQRAIDLLERSSITFLDSALVREEKHCTSCHQQAVPAAALGLARERGFRVNEQDVRRLIESQTRFWRSTVEAARELLEPQPDAPNNLGWGLQGLHALKYDPDEITESMVRYLVRMQRDDGSWRTYDRRPPIQDGPVVGTALAVRALQLFPLPGAELETRESLQRARRWLAQSQPRTHNERLFKLFGLAWCGDRPHELKSLVDELLAAQRPNGGWAQLPGREVDAWATGQALVALHQAGGLATADRAYQRGTEFLLHTQFDDGSWWVHSRTWPFQPHFDSKFPHGKDQWISAAGTAWAVMALLFAFDDKNVANVGPSQLVLSNVASKTSALATTLIRSSRGGPDSDLIDFGKRIQPVLERSCVGCHSGERAKGGLHLETRVGLMRGGQSREPAIVLGDSGRSPLVRFISDQVEDLEMPPISKRQKYPGLTPDEIGAFRSWIDQGASWPAEGVLKVQSERELRTGGSRRSSSGLPQQSFEPQGD